MQISVDNWTERKTKAGDSYHNFNVAVDLDEAILYLMGWQLFNGVVNPPSFRSGWRYYPMLLSGGAFASNLWDALAKDARRPSDAKLRPKEEAIDGLVASRMEFARLFPNS